jgi:hypothetical protein
MPTKQEQILDRWSTWNVTPNEGPVFVLRADDWRFVMLIAGFTDRQGGRTSATQLIECALKMKEWSDANDIPF